MGILFVLVFQFVVATILAVVGSVVLGFVSNRYLRHAAPRHRLRARRMIRKYIFLCIPYLFVAWVTYAVWCSAVRRVDPGIGDFFRAPLGRGYNLIAIDTPERGAVESPTGEQFGNGFTLVGFDEDSAYYESVDGGFERIDKGTGERERFATLAALERRLAHPADLRSTDEVYYSCRWSLADLWAALVLLALPARNGLRLLRRIRKIRDETAAIVRERGADVWTRELPPNPESVTARRPRLLLWSAAGIGTGALVGMALDQLFLGITIGAAFFLMLGAARSMRLAETTVESPEEELPTTPESVPARGARLLLWPAAGIGIGALVGVVLDQLFFGITIGAVFFLMLGAARSTVPAEAKVGSPEEPSK